MFAVEGKVALITGGLGGIGLEIIQALLKEGVKVSNKFHINLTLCLQSGFIGPKPNQTFAALNKKCNVGITQKLFLHLVDKNITEKNRNKKKRFIEHEGPMKVFESFVAVNRGLKYAK